MTELTGIPETNSEHLQLLRYEVGQKYKVHHDYIPYHRNRQGGPRILTVYLYLNDVEEGGETNFNKIPAEGEEITEDEEIIGLTVSPKRGRALIWPSTLDENPDQKDRRTTHQALPVLRGEKYGANAWFHLR